MTRAADNTAYAADEPQPLERAPEKTSPSGESGPPQHQTTGAENTSQTPTPFRTGGYDTERYIVETRAVATLEMLYRYLGTSWNDRMLKREIAHIQASIVRARALTNHKLGITGFADRASTWEARYPLQRPGEA